MELGKIAKHTLKKIPSGETVEIASLWENKTCVISFLRRFGCQLCRLHAKRLSAIKPTLDANDVTLIAIAPEELGADEFVKGNFFNGDIYVDVNKACYKDLGFKRLGFFGALGSIVGKKGRTAISDAKQEGVSGNFKGDGMQNGGALIVKKGGELLLGYVQEEPAENIALEDILAALDIKDTSNVPADTPKVSCNEEACSIVK